MKSSIKNIFSILSLRINPQNSGKGFSLIEIIVATAIASIILLIVYSTYSSSLRSIKDMTGFAEFYENINLAILKIDRDISNTYFKRGNNNLCFICKIDNDNSRLSFVSADHCDFNIKGNIKNPFYSSDIKEIGYYLEEDRDNPGLYLLFKREEAHYNEDPENGGEENIILENVTELKFEFKSGNNWVERWDSKLNQKFPTAVRTTINVKNYKGADEKFIFISNINLKKQ